MDFNENQLVFIKTQMRNCIKDCNKLVKKYGWNDEATSGCNDAIELAQSVVDTIEHKFWNLDDM